MTPREAYRILDVTESTGPLTLRAAWLTLASKLHPDQPGGDAKEMAKVNEAYRVARDAATRRVVQCPTCEGRGVIYSGKGFNRATKDCVICEGSGRIRA